MFLNLFRLKDWALIGPFAVASLVLGFWGFLASGHTVGDSVIQTIGLIRGAGSYAYGTAPLQLVIAQYLLPATALFGGAKLLLVNMRRDMRVALAHRARNHVVVCGLGDTGMQIVNSMHRAGKPVVAVALDGAGANALACERLGIPVLNGDASQPGLLKLAGLLRADSVIVTTGSDAQNLEVGLSAVESLAAQGRREVKLLIEVRSDWVLDTLADHRTASLGGANVEFQLFNTAIDTARLLLRMPAVLRGGGTWRLPLVDVGVVQPGSADEAPADPRVAFLDPVTVPYLTATTPLRAPNLVLLFASPQRLPAVAVRGALTAFLPARASRTAAGAWADGVALCAQDGAAAVSVLVHAGVQEVLAPTRWLTDRRGTCTDPALVGRARAAQRRAHAVPGLSTALLGTFVVTAAWARSSHSAWAGLLGAAEVALAVVLPGVLRRGGGRGQRAGPQGGQLGSGRRRR